MTAEIAILNKTAVALATDSAVTIQTSDGGMKIYNSINKLFGLSRCQPIGIMIFGSAQVMDTPWETIIKIFRDELKTSCYDTLEEYGEHFIKFLKKRNPLFSKEKQEAYLLYTVFKLYDEMKRISLRTARDYLRSHNGIPINVLVQIIATVVDKFYDNMRLHKRMPYLPPRFGVETTIKYRKRIRQVYSGVFQGLPINATLARKIFRITEMLLEKNAFPKGQYSGVVIAGFGKKEEFPAIIAYEIGGVMNNKLKYAMRVKNKIDIKTTAIVRPFAQSDEVATFMDGINPKYRREIHKYILNLLTQYPKTVIESIGVLSQKQKDSIINKTDSLVDKEIKNFSEQFAKYEKEKHSDSIVQAVSFLPKEELATMAEALVNITSIKRRMSTDEETVGGQTDVAIISKGDGFIWMKRKQYFDPKINPHFMAKYK